MPPLSLRPTEHVFGFVFLATAIIGLVSYVLPWGPVGDRDCDCCDRMISGIQVLGDVSGRVPLQWFAPLGLCMTGCMGAWFLCLPDHRLGPATQLLPTAGLVVALWTLGLTSSPVVAMGPGFCTCLACLFLAACGAFGLAAWAAPSLPPIDRPPVHGALRTWSGWKVRVAAALLLWGLTAGFGGGSLGRRTIALLPSFVVSVGPWPEVARLLIGSMLLAFSAALTCGFSITAVPRCGSRSGLFVAWFLTLLASLCALIIYASGAIGNDVRGMGVICVTAIALILDLAIAPFLLWRAIVAEDLQSVEAEVKARAESVAPGIRLDDRLRRQGIIP